MTINKSWIEVNSMKQILNFILDQLNLEYQTSSTSRNRSRPLRPKIITKPHLKNIQNILRTDRPTVKGVYKGLPENSNE